MKTFSLLLFLIASTGHAAEFACTDFAHQATILKVTYSITPIDGTRTLEGNYVLSTRDNGDVAGFITGANDSSRLFNLYQADQEGQPEPPIARATLQFGFGNEADLKLGNSTTLLFCQGELPTLYSVLRSFISSLYRASLTFG